uniref:Uncharacterized protein n=1 Tax=Ixodes ricinus TaxID=34613 RepID=A0A6B0USJ3_IXORI
MDVEGLFPLSWANGFGLNFHIVGIHSLDKYICLQKIVSYSKSTNLSTCSDQITNYRQNVTFNYNKKLERVRTFIMATAKQHYKTPSYLNASGHIMVKACGCEQHQECSTCKNVSFRTLKPYTNVYTCNIEY